MTFVVSFWMQALMRLHQSQLRLDFYQVWENYTWVSLVIHSSFPLYCITLLWLATTDLDWLVIILRKKVWLNIINSQTFFLMPCLYHFWNQRIIKLHQFQVRLGCCQNWPNLFLVCFVLIFVFLSSLIISHVLTYIISFVINNVLSYSR